ncbi:phosphate import ATP-binding protein PstB [Enterococcus faecalis]|nr:phosphate import ATP-binding protein PstB [Enterococcus faecalis]
MIEINNLNVFYNDFLALEKISVCIEKGAITGIVGPNGAGKSTFLKDVLNVIPHQGEVLIEKNNVKKIKENCVC